MKKFFKRKIVPIIILLVAVLIIGPINSAKAVVYSGYISVDFPSDFPTAKRHPVEFTDYLLEGESGKIFVHFTSYGGTGNVTIKASSDAFTGDISVTKNVSETDKPYIFELTFTIKSGIEEKSYTVDFEARNELGDLISDTSVTIRVWSIDHKEAADKLFNAQMRIGYYSIGYYYYGYGIARPTYKAPEAKANLTLALNEFAAAILAYHSKEWNSAKTHADNAIEYMNKADIAERKFVENSATSKTSYLLDLITYPSLIIAILLIVYIIVAIFRKIKPVQSKSLP